MVLPLTMWLPRGSCAFCLRDNLAGKKTKQCKLKHKYTLLGRAMMKNTPSVKAPNSIPRVGKKGTKMNEHRFTKNILVN